MKHSLVRQVVVLILCSVSAPSAEAFGLNPDQKRRAEQLTSIFENSTPELQYSYIENIGDGRGYTAGRAGFTTATGDLLFLLEEYILLAPKSPLIRYLPRLRELARNESSSTRGLPGFKKAWKKSAEDPLFRKAQDQAVEKLYYLPALELAKNTGVKSALSLAAIYDAAIQHGCGLDPDGLPALLARTRIQVHGTPASGISEERWLAGFLQMRRKVLRHPNDLASRSVWPDAVPRVDVLEGLSQVRNFELSGPLRVRVFDFNGVIH